MDSEFQFLAFISYKREDERWAIWLQRKLEKYRLPTALARQFPRLPKRLRPIFKDTTDIKPGPLYEVLSHNLRISKFLIVVCSPSAAKSIWVGKEISDFLDQGKHNNIIPFIVEGTPYSNNPETECYHPVMREKLPDMLGVNLLEQNTAWNYINRQKALIRIISALLNVSFDSLWKRQKKRMYRNVVISATLLLLSSIGLYGYANLVNRLNRPFQARVRLENEDEFNKNLPFENGKLQVLYSEDTIESGIINQSTISPVFKNIPGSFRGKKSLFRFRMPGFIPLDTLVPLDDSIRLTIRRDSSYYGCVTAFLRNIITENAISDRPVTIGNYSARTDKNGYFTIHIPPEEQKSSYKIRSNCQLLDSIIFMPTDSTVMIRTK